MQPDTIFRVVKKCFGELYDPLKFIYDLPLEKRIFPGDLKISRFNPVFMGGDRSKLVNYRPISVLPCLKYLSVLSGNSFQVGYSTDFAIIQLDYQIFEAFENNLYTPEVLIDLSKSLSNSESHDILPKKL